MRVHIPHVKLTHASHPDKDWRFLVTGFSVITIVAIATGFILWFWLQRSVDFTATIQLQKTHNQFDGLSAVTEIMNTRSEHFKEIQKTPHTIVDPSLLR